MSDWKNESSGHTCGKCGNEPGNNYCGDIGDYLCDNCLDDYNSVVELGYSVTDWINDNGN